MCTTLGSIRLATSRKARDVSDSLTNSAEPAKAESCSAAASERARSCPRVKPYCTCSARYGATRTRERNINNTIKRQSRFGGALWLAVWLDDSSMADFTLPGGGALL